MSKLSPYIAAPAILAIAIGSFIACSRRDATATSTTKEAWDPSNDPRLFGVATKPFNQIPTSGGVPQDGREWSGYYWPTQHGGLSNRWQTSQGDHYNDFLYPTLTPAQVANLSGAELNQLSPAEKMDIMMGRLDFPLVKAEQAKTLAAIGADGDVPSWFGICHGWAAASSHEKQPRPVTVNLGGGRLMTLNYADLGAYLSYAYAEPDQGQLAYIGGRCGAGQVARDATGRVVDPNCRDVNPASLHLVLAQYLGQSGQPILADMNMDAEVWNYPVTGYAFAYSGLRAYDRNDPWVAYRAPGTANLIDVSLRLYYGAMVTPTVSSVAQAPQTQDVAYTLELDARGYIIGGEWRSKTHPDFLWNVNGRPLGSKDGLVQLALLDRLQAAAQAGTVVDLPNLFPAQTSQPIPKPLPMPSPEPLPMPPPHNPLPPQPSRPSAPRPPLVTLTYFNIIDDINIRDTVLVQGIVQVPQIVRTRLIVVKNGGRQWEVREDRPVIPGQIFELRTKILTSVAEQIVVEGLNAAGQVVWRQVRPV